MPYPPHPQPLSPLPEEARLVMEILSEHEDTLRSQIDLVQSFLGEAPDAPLDQWKAAAHMLEDYGFLTSYLAWPKSLLREPPFTTQVWDVPTVTATEHLGSDPILLHVSMLAVRGARILEWLLQRHGIAFDIEAWHRQDTDGSYRRYLEALSALWKFLHSSGAFPDMKRFSPGRTSFRWHFGHESIWTRSSANASPHSWLRLNHNYQAITTYVGADVYIVRRYPPEYDIDDPDMGVPEVLRPVVSAAQGLHHAKDAWSYARRSVSTSKNTNTENLR